MAVARASVNVMKCGVQMRQGTRQHVFDAVASQHPRQRHLRGVDDDDNDVDDDNNDMRLPMQLPLTLRIRCLQRRELRGGGGGLSVGFLGLGVDDDDDDVDDDDDDTRLPMQLPLKLQCRRLQRCELRGGGGGLSVVVAVTSENVCRRR